jgi:hypothetical protein
MKKKVFIHQGRGGRTFPHLPSGDAIQTAQCAFGQVEDRSLEPIEDLKWTTGSPSFVRGRLSKSGFFVHRAALLHRQALKRSEFALQDDNRGLFYMKGESSV